MRKYNLPVLPVKSRKVYLRTTRPIKSEVIAHREYIGKHPYTGREIDVMVWPRWSIDVLPIITLRELHVLNLDSKDVFWWVDDEGYEVEMEEL